MSRVYETAKQALQICQIPPNYPHLEPLARTAIEYAEAGYNPREVAQAVLNRLQQLEYRVDDHERRISQLESVEHREQEFAKEVFRWCATILLLLSGVLVLGLFLRATIAAVPIPNSTTIIERVR